MFHNVASRLSQGRYHFEVGRGECPGLADLYCVAYDIHGPMVNNTSISEIYCKNTLLFLYSKSVYNVSVHNLTYHVLSDQ